MAQPADATTPRDVPQPRVSTLPFPVVGVGASAGGMAAAVELFTQMPDLSGMAFVLVLHLSPEHESHAAEILQRVTRLRVVQVTETMAIQPDHLYVIAPALNLTMDDGQLVVQPPQPSRGRPVAIDLFFRTLAQAHRERAVAVVLSGTGADGTLGLGEIKAEGGVTIAQAPADAEYDGMPSVAVASGRVDFVLPAAEIAAKLVDLWQNARCIEQPDPADCDPRASSQDGASAEVRAAAALNDVLEILAARTGNEFRHYKRGTVLRRIERRMQVTRQPNVPAYRDYLDRYPQESEQLLQDMLISVTSFFRDREAFESLGRELAANLAGRRPAPVQVRAWAVGCATGEEGYSLAMLLNDHVPSTLPRIGIQVFASDIDDRALAVARGGTYPETVRADVSASRLAQFFETDAGSYRVKKGLREQILFTRHNVLRDPPFSRLDVITCRNLLIYLERDVQARVLEVFHFALNPGGLLMLGSAESADLLTDLFSVVDKKQRLYRANPVRPVHRELLPQIVPMASLALSSRAAHHDIASLAQVHQRLRSEHDSASIVLDMHGNVLHASAGASRYLRHVEGVPSQDVLELVLPDLASALRPALFLARRSGQRVAAKPVTITGEQGTITLQMTIRGQQSTGQTGRLLVLFDEVDTSLAEQADVAPDGRGAAYRALEDEVTRLQSQLQGTIGDSAASGEALRASNEELQSINEELRSATEELETSKEELQSVNEELTTVNFELKHKVEETAKVNDDLNNLIASMNIATIFVDRRLRIKGFTPLANRVFNILSTDVGRPLGDLTHRLHYDQVTQDVSQVLSTLQPAEQEISSDDGRWYLMRVSAYRTNEDRIDGAVLNFIDVTERRAAQEQLRSRDERLRLVAESTKDYAVITLDAQGGVTGWNKGAQLMFGYVESEMLGEHFRRLFVPEDRATGAPEQELRAARDLGRALDERWHLRKDGSRFYCSGITTPLLEAGVDGFAKIARDLTERRLLEREREELLQAEKDVRQQLEAAQALRSQFLAVMSHELKNPLNLVMLNTELLARSPEVVADPRLARATDTIRRAVQGQAQIIDDLLDLSRLNTGKLSLTRTPVQWHAIIERIADPLRAEAAAKQFAFEVQAEPLTVYADMVRVEQVTWNLVSNAFKFTPPAGAIHIRLKRDGMSALLEVEDTGRGIEPRFIAQVFDMFEQGAGPASTRRDGGLGIGLALVKSLAELHGGSVHVRSEGAGKGAVFSVRLPLFDGGAQADDGRSAPVRHGVFSGRRVLLVDDSLDTLESLGDVLASEGALVTKAESGVDALARAQESEFDLLLSDIAMPGMSGLELIERLKQLPKPQRWTTVAVSGFGQPDDAARSAAAGFDAHLAKPLSFEALEAIVQRFVSR